MSPKTDPETRSRVEALLPLFTSKKNLLENLPKSEKTVCLSTVERFRREKKMEAQGWKKPPRKFPKHLQPHQEDREVDWPQEPADDFWNGKAFRNVALVCKKHFEKYSWHLSGEKAKGSGTHRQAKGPKVWAWGKILEKILNSSMTYRMDDLQSWYGPNGLRDQWKFKNNSEALRCLRSWSNGTCRSLRVVQIKNPHSSMRTQIVANTCWNNG